MFPSMIALCLSLSYMPIKILACDGSLPVVDLEDPDAAFNLVDAFQSWGFSYVKGHNVDEDIIKNAEKHSKRFFRRVGMAPIQLTFFRNVNKLPDFFFKM